MTDSTSARRPSKRRHIKIHMKTHLTKHLNHVEFLIDNSKHVIVPSLNTDSKHHRLTLHLDSKTKLTFTYDTIYERNSVPDAPTHMYN